MSLDEPTESWRRICERLRDAVDETAWQLWLEPLVPRSHEGDALVVEMPGAGYSWVRERYGRMLDACAAAVLGEGARIEFVAAGTVAGGLSTPGPLRVPDVPLDPRLTFEQFVIGDSNRLAHAAALAVAEQPSQAYNPLFICGPPGLGKTHLLHSIGNYVAAFGDGLTVRYTTVEAFTNAFVGALQGHDLTAFKAAYRGTDVLLVDDVQFLAAKVRTEQEFFHTFNALQGAGAQLVLTSDRLPRDLDAVEDRLRERFEAGLVTDVRPPDFATRLTILRQHVRQDELAGVDPAALGVIAERVASNIRALQGALIRTVAFGSLTGREVSAALAREVLDGLHPELRPRERTLREIQERVAIAYGVPVDDLVSSSRAARIAWPRQIAMYLARELTDDSLPAIGRAFGGRSHTTVLHACKRAVERMSSDPEAYETVRRLSEELAR